MQKIALIAVSALGMAEAFAPGAMLPATARESPSLLPQDRPKEQSARCPTDMIGSVTTFKEGGWPSLEAYVVHGLENGGYFETRKGYLPG